MKFVYVFLSLLVLNLTLTAGAQVDNNIDGLDPDAMAEDFVQILNEYLVENEGYPALARNTILDDVALSIAESVGCTDAVIELNVQERTLEAGYAVFEGDALPRVTRNPLASIVNQSPIESVAELAVSQIYGNAIAQPGQFYREIGVGVFPCVVNEGDNAIGSNQQYALFVILGSQPNVLPVVIASGNPALDVEEAPIELTISFHEEDTRPRPDNFGQGDTLKLDDEPLTDETLEQDFESFVSWEFESCGTHTLYYEIADKNGNTLSGDVSIELVCDSE